MAKLFPGNQFSTLKGNIFVGYKKPILRPVYTYDLTVIIGKSVRFIWRGTVMLKLSNVAIGKDMNISIFEQ